MSRFIHLPLPAALKARLEAPGAWGAGARADGCADASLYHRMQQARLTGIIKMPQVAVGDDKDALQNLERNILSLLSTAEMETWKAAVADAESKGSWGCWHQTIAVVPKELQQAQYGSGG
jgi:hypothetical protein